MNDGEGTTDGLEVANDLGIAGVHKRSFEIESYKARRYYAAHDVFLGRSRVVGPRMSMSPRIEIGIDSRAPEALAPFWAEALGYRVGDFDGDRTYLDLVPPDQAAPVVFLQRVPEQKTVKNRVHIDLYSSEPTVLVERLVVLGAQVRGHPRTGAAGGWWLVMEDPEGNEFCVCRDD